MDRANARWSGRAGHGLVASAGLATAMHVVLLLALRPAVVTAPVASSPTVVRMIQVAAAEARSQGRTPIWLPTLQRASTTAPPPLPTGRDPDAPVAPANSEYLTPEQLSQRPTALTTISIPYPEVDGQSLVATAILTLYINERGTVDLVQVEDPDVPAPFADAARSAFGFATFSPGRIEDRPVKSRIRVEANFEPGEAAP